MARPAELQTEPGQEQEAAARQFLYAVEMVGDPGAAELLMAEAAGRAVRLHRTAAADSGHRAILAALTLAGQGALVRYPRPAIPSGLLPPDDVFDRELESALAGLPGRERAAFFLALVEGLGYEEIAAVLRTTPANAGALVYRARSVLCSRLVGQAGADSLPATSSGPGTGGGSLTKVLRGDCGGAAPFISSLIDGQLRPKQLGLMENHLRECVPCRAERDRLERTNAAVLGHWRQMLDHLVSGGWSRRARQVVLRSSSVRLVSVRARRTRRLLAAACVAIVVLGALLWAGPHFSEPPAVTGRSGPVERDGDDWLASGDATLELFDGSRVRLTSGAAMGVERLEEAGRPLVWLLRGSVEVTVSPGMHDLVVESAAGRAAASGGSFTATLLARDALGSRMDMRFPSAESLASGERLTLLVDSSSGRLIVTGRAGQEIPVPDGSLAMVPCGERPAILASPGQWQELPRWGGLPPARRGAALTLDATEGLAALYGGAGGGHQLGELWAVDPLIGAWFQSADRPGTSEAELPAPQIPAGLLADPAGAGLWLYPGGASKPEAGLWSRRGGIINGVWQRVETPSPGLDPRAAPPTGRAGPAMTDSAAAGGIVLFGGAAGAQTQKDTWLLEAAKPEWRRVADKGRSPEARAGAAMAACGGGARVYMFGGRSASRAALDDTWRLDFPADGEASWSLLTTKHRPPGRWNACLVAVGEGGKDRLVLFGGRPRLGGPLDDTWVLSDGPDGPDWERLAARNAPPGVEQEASPLIWLAGPRVLVLWGGESLWTLRLRRTAEPPAGE